MGSETRGAMTPTLADDKIGIRVKCSVCGNTKNPIGRSAPVSWYGCDDECRGYRQEPYPGSLWPGESEAEFGYPVGNYGTTRRTT